MAILLPAAATTWMHAHEVFCGRFAPGASTDGQGNPNPAGPRTGTVLDVESGLISGARSGTFTAGSINAAMFAARYGDDIVCAAQANRPGGYVGTFQIPLDAGTTGGSANKAVVPGVTPMLPWHPSEPSYIRLMSSAWATLPLRRVGPADTATLFLLKGFDGGANNIPVLSDAANDTNNPSMDATRQHHYRFEGMQIDPGDPCLFLIWFGWTNFLHNGPMHHMVLDRCYLRGNPTDVAGKSAFRGILNACNSFAALHSRIGGINSNANSDCSAVLIAAQTSGPVYFYNCDLSGATQCAMHGGTANDYPQNVLYERCVLGWDPKWQRDLYASTGTATVASNVVTGTGTNFNISYGGTHDWFFVAGQASPPTRVTSGFTSTTTHLTVASYPDLTGGQCGILSEGMLDSGAPARSAGVTVTVSGTTVTRSGGTFPRQVRVGSYFFVLNALAPTRYRITAIASDRASLTLASGPGDASGVVNWVIGTWDGQAWPGTLKNLWETKTGTQFTLKDCVFQDYWFDERNQGQQWAIAFKGTGDSTRGALGSGDFTVSGCLFQRCASFYSDLSVYASTGPVLLEDNLLLLGDPFPTNCVGFWSQPGQPNLTTRHCTFVVPDASAVPKLFQMGTGGANYNFLDNLVACGADVSFQDTQDGHGPDVEDLCWTALGSSLTNLAGNVAFGGTAVTGIRTPNYWRTNALTGFPYALRYASAALDAITSVGFVNPTGADDGDYRLQPIYTTDVGDCAISGTTVTVTTSTIPATVQQGTLFKVTRDADQWLTSVASRASDGKSVTLAASYLGSTGSSQTGVFTFQGSATDGLDPGVRALAARLAIWADVQAGTLTPVETPPPTPIAAAFAGAVL